jgi:hypothetical protein
VESDQAHEKAQREADDEPIRDQRLHGVVIRVCPRPLRNRSRRGARPRPLLRRLLRVPSEGGATRSSGAAPQGAGVRTTVKRWVAPPSLKDPRSAPTGGPRHRPVDGVNDPPMTRMSCS